MVRQSLAHVRLAAERSKDAHFGKVGVLPIGGRELIEGQQDMFTHVIVGANDLAASKKFYDAVFGAIGVTAGQADPKGRFFYRTKTGVFGITKPIDGKGATHPNGGKKRIAWRHPRR